MGGYDAQTYSYEPVDEEMHECKEEQADEGFDSSNYAVEYPQQVASPHQAPQPWNDAVCPPPSSSPAAWRDKYSRRVHPHRLT